MAKTTRKRKTNAKPYKPPTYGAYLFKEKDPVIDELRTLAADFFQRPIDGKGLGEIEKGGGPKVSTMRAWFFGPTMRPTSATVEAAGRSIGFERTWRKRKT